jgi:PilZ domain
MGCHVAYGDRKSERIEFERGFDVYIMGIDGTWRRDGKMHDVSQTGARLTVNGSLQGIDLKEFFLLLSSTGLAYRRCRMVRLAGDQIGVEFLKPTTEKSKKATIEKNQQKLERQ